MHRAYENEDITVFWDSEKCFHARECVRGCPEVFDITKRPWIDMSRAESARIWQTVSRCPSKALICAYKHEVSIEFDEAAKRSTAYAGDSREPVGECDPRLFLRREGIITDNSRRRIV